MLTQKGRIFASLLVLAAIAMATMFSMCSSSEEDRLLKYQEEYNAYKVKSDTVATPTHIQELKVSYPPSDYNMPVIKKKPAKKRYPRATWGNSSNIRVERGPYGDLCVVDDQSIYLSAKAAEELAASDSVAIFNPYLHGYLLAAVEMIKDSIEGPVSINNWLVSSGTTTWVQDTDSGTLEPEVESAAIGMNAIFLINGDTVSTNWIEDYLRAIGYPSGMEIEMDVALEAAKSLSKGDPGAAFRNADAVFERGTSKTLAEYARYVGIRKLAEK